MGTSRCAYPKTSMYSNAALTAGPADDASFRLAHMISIGIDAGGTFTDYVVYDPRDGRLEIGKVSSTPDAPQAAVLSALIEGESRVAPVDRVVHGTTVGTNALLEQKGARVALLTTRGFRDTLEI